MTHEEFCDDLKFNGIASINEEKINGMTKEALVVHSKHIIRDLNSFKRKYAVNFLTRLWLSKFGRGAENERI